MSWLNTLFGVTAESWEAPPEPRKLSVPFPQGYTAEKWFANPELAYAAQKLYEEALFRNILAVLQNSIPRGYPSRGQVVNEATGLIELGRFQGYMDCLDLINSLGIPPKTTEEVPVDWNAQVEP